MASGLPQYPGNNAGRQALAQWMAQYAQASGLPGELPVMAAIPESGIANLSGGDRDSAGFFQMRQGIWGKQYGNYVQNPESQMKWFVDQALKANRGKSLGEWVANIERPAEQYRGKYGAAQKEAQSLIGSMHPGTNAATPSVTTSSSVLGVTAGSTPYSNKMLQQSARQDFMSALMQGNDPSAGLSNTVAAMRQMVAINDMANTPVPVGGNVASETKGLDVNAIAAMGGTESGSKAVAVASKYIGVPYVWGGSTPKGFDCSGLMQYAYSQLGISIPRTSQEQWKATAGSRLSAGQLSPGDAVFFGTPDNVHHVGMYIGNGKFLQAPRTGDVVKISALSKRTDFLGGGRFATK